jgi:hypothetical protein
VGLDFDYSHSRITISGQSIAIIKRKETTSWFHHMGYEIWAHILHPSWLDQTSCHHITEDCKRGTNIFLGFILNYLTYEVSIFQLLKSSLWELHVFHEERNVCHLFAKCF